MLRTTWIVTVLLGAAACAHQASDAKLDELLAKVQDLQERTAKLEKKINAIQQTTQRLDEIIRAAVGAEPGGEAAQEPPSPDPDTVFSVPIDGDPVRGPKTAKVTIVEGAEFA